MKKPAMIRVVSIKNGVRYSGILRPIGTEFDVRIQDAKILTAIGKVEKVEVKAAVAEVPPTVTVHRTPKVQEPSKAGQLPTDGEYMRRDVPSESLDRKKTEEKEEPPKGRSKYIKDDVKKELAKAGE